MATIKRISGDYTIQSINPADTINLKTSAVVISGNLVVLGNTAVLETNNTVIYDNIVTLNGGLSPNTAPYLNAGIEVNRGTLANTSIIWNESVQSWQMTNDGTTFSNVITANSTISLAGNIDTKTFSIYSSTSPQVKIDGNLALQNTATAPAAIVGYGTLYSSTVSGGGSGIYVTNTTTGSQELITKSKAIVYSLIF